MESSVSAHSSRERMANLLGSRCAVEIHNNEHAEISCLLNDSIQILQVYDRKVLAAVDDTSQTPVSNGNPDRIQSRIANVLNRGWRDPSSAVIVKDFIRLRLTE